MIFDPKTADVRRFFCGVWAKHRDGRPLTPIEDQALTLILMHPEVHPDLADLDRALAADYPADGGRANPFLHLSLHLAIAEQHSIDQPPGIRACLAALERRLGDRHAALHQALECLAETIWQAQRSGQPLDGQAYVDRLRRRAGLPPEGPPPDRRPPDPAAPSSAH